MARGQEMSAAAVGPPAAGRPARHQHHGRRDNKTTSQPEELRKEHATAATMKRPAAARSNRMGDAIAEGRWWSVLTFSWARSFLELGSAVTLQEEHLEEIYESHERFAGEWVQSAIVCHLLCNIDFSGGSSSTRGEGPRVRCRADQRLWACVRYTDFAPVWVDEHRSPA